MKATPAIQDRVAGSSEHGLLITTRGAALLAGISYVAMFVLAIFANFVVRQGLIEPDNAAVTVANLTVSIGLFRLGVIAFLVIFLLDVVIAWALYIVFREVSRDLSLGAAWFRLVYSAFLGVALVFLYRAMQLVTDAGIASALGGDQINAQTMVALESFDKVWRVGLVAFGVHLVLIGYLVIRSGMASPVLGYLLVAAGIAYGLDSVARTLMDNYPSFAALFQAMVAVPSMIGEGWLGLWLLLGRRHAG